MHQDPQEHSLYETQESNHNGGSLADEQLGSHEHKDGIKICRSLRCSLCWLKSSVEFVRYSR